jgi:twinkle protein
MGRIVSKNNPCLNPECGSSDARQIYEDDTSFCFSCQTFFKAEEDTGERMTTSPSLILKSAKTSIEEIATYPVRGFKERGITKNITEFFGVKVSYNDAGEIDTHYYPYIDGDNVSYKIRKLPKVFSSVGTFRGLFGKDVFQGGGKRLIITEGELDALTVAQCSYDKYKKIYPVISIPSASGTQQLLENREWIRSFSEVVLCLDNDKAGEEATNKAIKIIGIDKVKIAKLPFKDPSEVFLKKGSEELLRCVWDATPYTPAGIIGKDELWTALQEYNSKESVPYPDCLKGVNAKLKGHRTGEIVLFISGTGSGKSTILREDMLHLLETTNDKIGVVSLEEAPAETARKLAGMYLNRNPSDEEIPLEDLKVGFDKVFGNDRIILLDHQGSINDGSIVDQLEYMALSGCKYIFVDHITILVSEGAEGLSGNEAIDKVMNDLLRLVKSHDVWIGLVSHLRKAPSSGKSFEEGKLPSIDDIRGSGSIKQISFDIIAFARDLTATAESERNAIKMTVLKARHTGLTGPVAGCAYTHKTGRLHATDIMSDESFQII